MADKIGVNRKWWQSPEKTSGSHYDIALSKDAVEWLKNFREMQKNKKDS